MVSSWGYGWVGVAKPVFEPQLTSMIPPKHRDTTSETSNLNIEGSYESHDAKLISTRQLAERKEHEDAAWRSHTSSTLLVAGVRCLPTFAFHLGVDSTTPLALHATGYAGALRR